MSDVDRVLLAAAVEQAFHELASTVDGDLPLGRRQLIWSALGRRGGLQSRTEGQLRRALLACSAARRALPIWNHALPHDALALRALIEAERITHGVSDVKQAYLLRDRTILDLSERANLPIDVQCAGYAAVKALTTAINDERFDALHIDPRQTDRDIDSQHLDAAFFAASAEAGGPPWVAAPNQERRSSFWKWWLEQALSHAGN